MSCVGACLANARFECAIAWRTVFCRCYYTNANTVYLRQLIVRQHAHCGGRAIYYVLVFVVFYNLKWAAALLNSTQLAARAPPLDERDAGGVGYFFDKFRGCYCRKFRVCMDSQTEADVDCCSDVG